MKNPSIKGFYWPEKRLLQLVVDLVLEVMIDTSLSNGAQISWVAPTNCHAFAEALTEHT